jgi:hypothetical protein
MRIVQLTVVSDADGLLRFAIPADGPAGRFEVAVVLTPIPTTNGTAAKRTPEELGWPPGYFERTAGSIPDETFQVHPSPPLRPVEPLGYAPGWPQGYFEAVTGSIEDDRFVRPPQPALSPPVSLE